MNALQAIDNESSEKDIEEVLTNPLLMKMLEQLRQEQRESEIKPTPI